jgi:outer membrane protein, heavy metal efflux system
MTENAIRSTNGSRQRTFSVVTLPMLVCMLPAAAHSQHPLSLADPALTQAIERSVAETSPDLVARRAALLAAQAQADASGFAGPAILSGEVDDVSGVDFGYAGYRLEIGYELLTRGRSAAARALAATDVRRAEAELRATERRVSALTLRHVARVIAASWTARRLAAEDSLLMAAEASVRDRFSVGEARYVDVLRLRTERLRVQTDRAAALAETRAEQKSLLGLSGDEGAASVVALVDSASASATPAEDASLPPAPSLDSLVAASGRLRLAETALERTQAAREVVRAERRTRFAGAIGAQRRFEDGSNHFGPVLAASVSLPFTAGRANRAALEAAEREIRAAEAARAAVAARVRAGISAALARYEAARERVAAFDVALLRGAREERESALAAYRTGDMSLIELLDFERALARAEIERIRARADAAEAWANLSLAADGEG